MRKRHNKKRNTAFLFELLNRAYAKSIIENDSARRDIILSIIKESFKKGTALYKELQIYNSILDSEVLSPRIAEKTLYEARRSYDRIHPARLFQEQSVLIKKLNKSLEKDFYSYFVPNYKNMATLYQLLNLDLSPKKKVMLEENIISYMSSKTEVKPNIVKPVDKLTFKVFLEKFNSTYGDNLLKEQKELLNNYIVSYKDNSLDLKIYLNKELKRLRESVVKSLEEIEDHNINNKLNEVVKIIDGYKQKQINKSMVEQVLGIQSLVREMADYGN